MQYKKFHKWNISPEKAIKIQKKLQKKIIITSLKNVNNLVACDVAYSNKFKKIFAVALIFKYPSLKMIKKYSSTLSYKKIDLYPYISSLLSFREIPILLPVLEKIKMKVDLLLVDGHGLIHPRFMGIATHLGILLNCPSIGCAKNPLLQPQNTPKNKFMSYKTIAYQGRKLGVVLRSKPDTNPIYVSPGYKTDIPSILKIIRNCIKSYKIPFPLREAHIFSKKIKNQYNKDNI